MIARYLTLVLSVALLAAAPTAVPASDVAAGWYVLSYDHPIRGADREALAEVGARAVFYRPHDAYVALLDHDAVRALHGPDVRALTPRQKVAAEPGLVSVIAAGGRATLDRLASIAPVARASLATADGALLETVALADARQLRRLAADPAVLTIGRAATGVHLLEEATAQVVAGNVTNGKPDAGYRAFLDGLGLGGEGITIAIADSGIDDNHPDLAGRVAARIDYTTLPDYKDSDGHGTHVAGIAAGSGEGLPLATDRDGLAYGMGVAPDATMLDIGVLGIIEEVIEMDDFPPFQEATAFAVRNGAVAWNASWGSGEGTRAGYTQTASIMDVISRDADWETPGAQPLILVFAAGNDGTAGPGAPTEAKNMISVAASLSWRSGDIDQIAGFSSRGPTLDGRIGPTVAAPGDQIVSTRAMPASVLCNVPPRDRTPMSPFYGLCSGTSMAAPHVTGAVALIAQWWATSHAGAVPSQAMTKALLVNSATDMGRADIPNGNEGWGRVNLRALFDPLAVRILEDQTHVFDEVGEQRSVRIAPADPSRPMKITLAWSDASAMPNAPLALVNDLDLRLIAEDGTSYWGNAFANGRSVAGGSPDRLEVLENVFINAPSGTYTVELTAANLPGDGVPHAGDTTDQDYALVLTNAVLVS